MSGSSDEQDLPAQARHLRLAGTLPCCQAAVRASTRRTTVGSLLECPTCHGVYRVAPDQTWTWEPGATVETLRGISTTGYNERSA